MDTLRGVAEIDKGEVNIIVSATNVTNNVHDTSDVVVKKVNRS